MQGARSSPSSSSVWSSRWERPCLWHLSALTGGYEGQRYFLTLFPSCYLGEVVALPLCLLPQFQSPQTVCENGVKDLWRLLTISVELSITITVMKKSCLPISKFSYLLMREFEDEKMLLFSPFFFHG